MSGQWHDSDFMSEAAAARQNRIHPFAHLLLLIIALFFLFALIWADHAELDEVTVGIGKVIPSGQVKLVQSLEGGILSELLVSEGKLVEKDQILLHIDDTQFQASFRESHTKFIALTAQAARLEAEANDTPLILPALVREEQPALAADEEKLFVSRKNELKSTVSQLKSQVTQREQELLGLTAAAKQLDRRLELLRKEVALTSPMVKQGIMS